MNLKIKDIAEKAGVSKTTISRAINDETRSKIAPRTLKRIEKIIAESGYTPNLAAKHLRKTLTKTIGVAFPAFPGVFDHSHYVKLLSGISDYMMETNYQLKLLLLKPDVTKWANYDFKSVERIDGLIVTHWPEFFTKESVYKLRLPCVFINDLVSEFPAYFVCGDHFMGGQLAGRHLYELGHRRVAVLKGIDWCLDNHLRADGLIQYFSQQGVKMPMDYVICANYREDQAYEKVDRLLQKHSDITAIFCCNDDMALGVMRRLKEKKIQCPEQISVIGFDNVLRSSISIPSLTTLQFSEYDAAWEGVMTLIRFLDQGDLSHPLRGHKLYPVELIKRNSTGPARVS